MPGIYLITRLFLNTFLKRPADTAGTPLPFRALPIIFVNSYVLSCLTKEIFHNKSPVFYINNLNVDQSSPGKLKAFHFAKAYL